MTNKIYNSESSPNISGRKLKSSKLFDKAYLNGTNIISGDKIIKARYFLLDQIIKPRMQFAITVSSKAGGAVWRNRIRRIIYESVRTELNSFYEMISSTKFSMLVIFSPNKLNQQNNNHIAFNDIKLSILDIQKKLKNVVITSNKFKPTNI